MHVKEIYSSMYNVSAPKMMYRLMHRSRSYHGWCMRVYERESVDDVDDVSRRAAGKVPATDMPAQENARDESARDVDFPNKRANYRIMYFCGTGGLPTLLHP